MSTENHRLDDTLKENSQNTDNMMRSSSSSRYISRQTSPLGGAVAFLHRFQSAVAAGLYVSIGVILIMSTKYILKNLEFPFPIFISTCGQLFTSITVRLLVHFRYVVIRPEIQKIMSFKFLMTRIGSIGLFATLALVLGNYSYLYLNVSLIQALKSFTPVAVMTLSFLILKLVITVQLFIAICILTLGTLICTGDLWFGESESTSTQNGISIFGVTLMLCSALSEALKVVLTQKLLKGVYTNNHKPKTSEIELPSSSFERARLIAEDGSEDVEMKYDERMDIKLTVHESMYYYAPVSCVFMMALIVVFEAEELRSGYDKYMQIIMDNVFVFVVVSVLGYGVMISSFLVTKYFSGLYLKALSVCRNFILVLLVVYFGEIMTNFQIIGYTISIIGFVYYNYIRLQLPQK